MTHEDPRTEGHLRNFPQKTKSPNCFSGAHLFSLRPLSFSVLLIRVYCRSFRSHLCGTWNFPNPVSELTVMSRLLLASRQEQLYQRAREKRGPRNQFRFRVAPVAQLLTEVYPGGPTPPRSLGKYCRQIPFDKNPPFRPDVSLSLGVALPSPISDR